MQELQKSDFHILKWSTDDMSAYSPELRTLGSPLELGKELYKDLQTTYHSKRQKESSWLAATTLYFFVVLLSMLS